MVSFLKLHAPLQQLSFLINLQALSQWPPSFEWHFRVQAEITSPATKLTWSSFHIRGALRQSSMCGDCLCVSSSARVCVCVYVAISFLYRFGGLMRAWNSSPQRRVNLRHLLCTSSIFLDSWHFTSWTNCQLSKLNFRNDMSKFTHSPHPPPQSLLHSCSLFLSPISPSIYLFAFTCMPSRRIFCTHMEKKRVHVHTYTWEDKWSSVLAPPPLLRPTFRYRLNSLAMVVLYATS